MGVPTACVESGLDLCLLQNRLSLHLDLASTQTSTGNKYVQTVPARRLQHLASLITLRVHAQWFRFGLMPNWSYSGTGLLQWNTICFQILVLFGIA